MNPIWREAIRKKIILLATVLAALGLPNTAWSQTAACTKSVLVQQGESLSTIAGREVGSQALYFLIVQATNSAAESDATYTRINNPSFIRHGWKLCIPTGTPGTPAAATTVPSATVSPTTALPQTPAVPAAPGSVRSVSFVGTVSTTAVNQASAGFYPSQNVIPASLLWMNTASGSPVRL